MSKSKLKPFLDRLEHLGQLRQIEEEVDPYLEMAEIHRRVYAAQGPALYFKRIKGSPFPCVSNLFGTRERTLALLGKGVQRVQELVRLRNEPLRALQNPIPSLGSLWNLRKAFPLPTLFPTVIQCETNILTLPQIVSWPKDGGAFITLPLVYTEHPDRPGLWSSNLGMYRVQISGGEYIPNQEIGLHYQIHRGIGVHHHAAIQRGEKLRVSIFVGGPPAHILAAIMPLPEGMPEILFAGLLGNAAFKYARRGGHLLSADADFCITGTIDPHRTLPEGPFGDHMGYYSLVHPFPVMQVERVYHRRGAIWPFTLVGRPPQEDAQLAELIHEIAGEALPQEIPGLHKVHAVEAAGVHPLLLAVASDRYLPYAGRKPRELHTIGHALLGYGQLSLAKYLMLAAHEDNRDLDIRNVSAFLTHILQRVNWETDLHFMTRTTMDTLDYSGSGFNEGSKVMLAVSGASRRILGEKIPESLRRIWPENWTAPRQVLPGLLIFGGPAAIGEEAKPSRFSEELERLSTRCKTNGDVLESLQAWPLWVRVDDVEFTASSFERFLWVTFTRSDPARDIHGLFAFLEQKHWGCRGPMVIDSRLKPHHAPPLESDPDVARKVEQMASPGHSLHGIF